MAAASTGILGGVLEMFVGSSPTEFDKLLQKNISSDKEVSKVALLVFGLLNTGFTLFNKPDKESCKKAFDKVHDLGELISFAEEAKANAEKTKTDADKAAYAKALEECIKQFHTNYDYRSMVEEMQQLVVVGKQFFQSITDKMSTAPHRLNAFAGGSLRFEAARKGIEGYIKNLEQLNEALTAMDEPLKNEFNGFARRIETLQESSSSGWMRDLLKTRRPLYKETQKKYRSGGETTVLSERLNTEDPTRYCSLPSKDTETGKLLNSAPFQKVADLISGERVLSHELLYLIKKAKESYATLKKHIGPGEELTRHLSTMQACLDGDDYTLGGEGLARITTVNTMLDELAKVTQEFRTVAGEIAKVPDFTKEQLELIAQIDTVFFEQVVKVNGEFTTEIAKPLPGSTLAFSGLLKSLEAKLKSDTAAFEAVVNVIRKKADSEFLKKIAEGFAKADTPVAAASASASSASA